MMWKKIYAVQPYKENTNMLIKSRLKNYQVILEDDFSFLNDLALAENTQYVIDNNVYRIYQEWFRNIPED